MLQNKRKTIGYLQKKSKKNFRCVCAKESSKKQNYRDMMWQFLQIMESTDKIINILSVIK